ncbi:MAG: hypothetical protein ACJ77K_17700 [Bacteroidia bacterium]
MAYLWKKLYCWWTNKQIKRRVERAVSELTSLFDEAKTQSEFDFVLMLINYKGIGSKELSSNLHEWFDAIESYKRQYRSLDGKEKTRAAALLYSTFFENSDFYNIIGSLCRIKLGFRGSSYLFWKTRKYERLLGIGEKQDFLIELLEDAGKTNVTSFFIDNHFKEIRNSFFHSAYSLSGDQYILHDSETIKINGVGYYQFNIAEFFYPIVENVILFFDTFKKLYLDSFVSYRADKEIDARFPNPARAIILGSANGLKGYKIRNAVQFYGVWHDAGIWYDDRYEHWAGHNIHMYFANIETIEIQDSLARYGSKTDIARSDYEFHNLVSKVVERKIPGEVSRTVSLLIKFGDARKHKMIAEQNPFKQQGLAKTLLPFYRQAVEIGSGIIDLTRVKREISTLEEFLKE